MTQLQCPLCRGDAEPDTAPEVLGRHGNARVRVTDLPIRRCTYCEKVSVRYNDFITDFVQVLVGMNTLPLARKVGLFTKRNACSRCKGLLDDAERGPVNFKGKLDIADPAFEVDLSILASTCPRCSMPQIVPEGKPLEEDIRKAFLHGCQSVAIHCPTGE